MHETFNQVFMKLAELGEFDDFEKLETLVDAELK